MGMDKKFEFSGQTFVIDVKSMHGGTWQGTILWVQKQKRIAFRSTLELLRLMDSVLKTVEDLVWEDGGSAETKTISPEEL